MKRKNPVFKVLIFIITAAVILALIQLFNGDVFRIFELIWEWTYSLIVKIKDFLLQSDGFNRVARGPKG